MKWTSVNLLFFIAYNKNTYLDEYHSYNSNETYMFSKEDSSQDSL